MNYTTNYKLPLYEGNDVTSWMADDGFNGAMNKIDTAIANAASSASSANSAANTAISTANSALNVINSFENFKMNKLGVNALIGSFEGALSLDNQKQILLLNGFMTITNPDSAVMKIKNLLSTPLNPSSVRNVSLGTINFTQQARNGAYGFSGASNCLVQTNGVIQILSDTFTLNPNCNGILFFTWALSVSSWGLA